MARTRCRIRLVAALALALAGCFDDPIRETVELEFHRDGAATATFTVELDRPSAWRVRASARDRRLNERARALLEGWDPGLARLERLACESTGGAWERSGPHLIRFSRWARCADRRAVEKLFVDLPVLVELGDEPAEVRSWVAVRPLGGGVASRAERRRFERLLEGWLERLERYHGAAYELARRAEERPERAAALWRTALGDDPEDEAPGLDPDDERAAAELLEALEGAANAFSAEGADAESLDELARRVFDPLPGRLRITAPAPILERAGFLAESERRVVSPPSGLLGALARLEGRWLEPDPLTTLIDQIRRDEKEPPDVRRFASGDPRVRAEPPEASELRAAILDELELPREIWVVWRTPTDETSDRASAPAPELR